MNIDFSKTPDNESQPVEQGPTPAPASAVATTTPSGGLVLGDKLPTFSEIILPRVNLVASVGGLKDSFIPGSFVYDQRVVLYTPAAVNAKTSKVEREGTPPVVITVLGFRPTRFVQNVKGGSRGIVCNTEAEVTAAGGTLDYREFKLKEKDGMLRFDYLAEALLAIERPESVKDDDTVFIFEADGKKYALALYAMKASAYTVAKRTLFPARSIGCLRAGYPTHSWNLSSVLEPTPDKSSTYWKPVLVPNSKSTPAFLALAASVLSAPTTDSPDTE